MKRDKCNIRKLFLQVVTFLLRREHNLLEWDDPRADAPIQEPDDDTFETYLMHLVSKLRQFCCPFFLWGRWRRCGS